MMKRSILIVLIIGLLASCKKILFKEDMASTDPYTNFDYLWNQCNSKYTYFGLKEVNWDSIKVEYTAKLYPEMTDDSLFNVLGGMLEELRDDHANLVSDFNTSFFGVEYLGQDNYDWRIIVDNYLSKDYYVSGPFVHDFLSNKEIGYVRLSTFSTSIDNNSLDFILERYQDTKGMIIDLRENGGGRIANVFRILSRFVEEETLVYYSRIKAGPGHDEFSETEGAYLEPYDGKKYLKKVVVLTDRGTYSSGSLFSLATKALPNITLIGDTTGGGLGIPNGGQLPNGWRYRFSITQTLTLEQNEEYENGVPPDITTLFDWNVLQTDEILERAILELQ